MTLKFPPIYLLKTHIEKYPQELRRLEEELDPVWNTKETKIYLGKLASKTRAAHELHKIGLETREVPIYNERQNNEAKRTSDVSPTPRKRRRVESTMIDGKEVLALDPGSETESDRDGQPEDGPQDISIPKDNSLPIRHEQKSRTPESAEPHAGNQNVISVLRLEWYTDSIKAGRVLPHDKYLIYQGEIISKSKSQAAPGVTISRGNDILARAKEDTPPLARRGFRNHSSRKSGSQYSQSASQPALLHETTVEYEGTDMPPIPSYLHTKYCCQRPTPLHCPNEAFLAQLRIIKQARALEHENTSKLAYMRAIATVAAYPHSLMSAREVHRLLNCGNKIATLWREWHDTGHIAEVDGIEVDPRMQAFNVFYGIHDVNDGYAKKFYDNGWKDLDDVIEFGWATLTRNQQIGVKFYDEFQLRIPRSEVESTADMILNHANKIRDGFQMVICGGYRRGKPDCGDVDVVLSHPDEGATDSFLEKLLCSLEEGFYITHRLTVSSRNSDRGQSPVSWKGGMPKAGAGFDTLDHAFVVWQNPDWPTEAEDLKKDPAFQNPNPHRRVDIIISPWKTAGCAIVGWSGGTMFERDLRLYCKEKLNLKFDSSGVRKREDGSWVDLEAGDGDLLVKEKRVFAGLGLEWREPTERCTD